MKNHLYSIKILDPTVRHLYGDTIKIYSKTIQIGRDKACEIQYGEQWRNVSRIHASLKWGLSGLLIKDSTDSQNQTFIDGQLLTKGSIRIRANSTFQFAQNGPKIQIKLNKTITQFNYLEIVSFALLIVAILIFLYVLLLY